MGESLASERESDLESETEQSITPSTASGRGAGGKKNKGKAASEGERTTTTSSMRRHRVAKKEKAAKKIEIPNRLNSGGTDRIAFARFIGGGRAGDASGVFWCARLPLLGAFARCVSKFICTL